VSKDFERKFPSLVALPPQHHESSSDFKQMMINDVERCCLDKQRVIEALEKCRKKLGEEYVGIRTFHTLMIEELGL